MNIIGDVKGKRCIPLIYCRFRRHLVQRPSLWTGRRCHVGMRLCHAWCVVWWGRGSCVVLADRNDGHDDSILATEAVRVAQNIRQITIALLLAEAIMRISSSQSVSSLFD